jgi:geranylgeranyl pyrophosphate synthase
VAINAANAAYFLPFVLIRHCAGLTPAQRLEIHEALSREFVHGHFGQSHDICWSRGMDREALLAWASEATAARVLRAYGLKTGAAVAGPAAVACVVAGAGDRTRRAVDEFARAFGTAFQIVDDVLDYADAEDRRKPHGKDIGEGKLTYVVCRALQALGGPHRERLATIICSPALRAEPSVCREAMGLVRRSGVLDACRREAVAMFEDAWRVLSECLAPSEAATVLGAMCSRLIRADHPT